MRAGTRLDGMREKRAAKEMNCHRRCSRRGAACVQGSRIRLVLGCVISPLRQHAESRNLGQTLFGSPVEEIRPVCVCVHTYLVGFLYHISELHVLCQPVYFQECLMDACPINLHIPLHESTSTGELK